jgi:LysW-gamma-L-lysine carboxypeptidase
MDSVSLLADLLRIYSPTGEEVEAVEYLVRQMQSLGFDAFVDHAGNAVGVMGERSPTPTVMLLGHIDTVPGFIPVVRDGDRLAGRGAVDAKAPLAAFVMAACAARDAATASGATLMVVGAVGEEGDSRGAHYLKSRFQPAVTIIGEPSGWEKIAIGYKGCAAFEYSLRRSLKHSSVASETACEAVIGFWNRVVAWAADRNACIERVFDQVSPALRRMSSNSDGFSESASLGFSVRVPPSVNVEELEDVLTALRDDAELKMFDAVPAWRAEKNTPLVRAFLGAIRRAGGSPSFTVKSGTSDMNVVAPIWRTPILAYGPGDSTLDHTPDEHIRLWEYERAIEVLSQALVSLCGSRSITSSASPAGSVPLGAE